MPADPGNRLNPVQAVLTERESRDRGWWETMLDCFAADSYVAVSMYQGSGIEFAKGTMHNADAARARHRLGPPISFETDDRAVVSLPLAVELYTLIDDSACILTGYLRMLYRMQRSGVGGWQIARMEGIYERDELQTELPGQLIAIKPEEIASFRPSYRLLSWLAARRGLAVNQDLPGDDRPELVAATYEAAFAWAEVSPPS